MIIGKYVKAYNQKVDKLFIYQYGYFIKCTGHFIKIRVGRITVKIGSK